MNFDFSEEQRLLQHAARSYLADHCTLKRVRETLEGDALYDRELYSGVAEMGWLGTAVPEQYGGAGFGYLELALVAEELGASLAPTPHGSTAYLGVEALLLAGKDEQLQRWLPKLVTGDAIAAFALAEQPGRTGLGGVETRFENGRLRGTKLPVVDGDVAQIAIVVARGARGPCLTLVELDGPGVNRSSLDSIDPTRSQARLELHDAPAELLGAEGDGERLVRELYDRAAVLFAFEQVGGAERCLDMTRDYAMNRYAFGRPIASYQALKHRMADMYVALELARSNAYYGAWALSKNAAELPIAASLARISATEAYRLCAEETVQMHGGVGFTWEFDCHMFYRRSQLLSSNLGSVNVWKDRLIRLLAEQAQES